MQEDTVVAMVRMGQMKDFPENQVEDALCSGWLRAEDAPEEASEPKRRGRPAKV